MLEHIQSLPARRHLSASIDTTFGTGGGVRFSGAIDRVISLSSETYVEHVLPNGLAITKLHATGAVDTAWATAGTATLPFGVFDAWAYDPRSRGLLVAGHTDNSDFDNATLSVLRLAVDGKPDAAFGTDGVYAYTPPLTPSENGFESAYVTAESINPVPHGEVLVGLSRRHSHTDRTNDPDFPSVVDIFTYTTSDSTLLKLRGNGTRQVRFGHRGMSVLASATATSENYDGDRSGHSDTLHIAGVTLQADGGAKAVLTETGATQDNSDITAFRFDVLSRSVDAAGVFNPATQADWNLLNNSDRTSNTVSTFDDLLVQPTDTGVFVVGRTVRDGVKAAPIAFTLTPRRKPAATALTLPTGVVLDAITPVRFGLLATGHIDAATGYQTVVTRLNARFRPDVRWGDHGSIENDVGTLTPDPDGRLLLANDDRLVRLTIDSSQV